MERADELHRPKTDEEEQTFNGSSNGRHYRQNGGNGRHLKKKKEKEKPVKIQQRGRGVAELEKQRILDEQINEGVVIPSTTVNTPPRAKNLLNRSASVPLRPPFFTRTQSPYYWAWDDHFAYVRENPHLNFGHQNPMQLTSVQNGISGPNEFFSTEGSGSNQMNSEYTRESEKLTRSANNLRRTSSLQLGNQQSYFYSPSMANHLAASSLSAVMNFQTEPPSNQSHFGTNRSVHPDEAEKTAGTRRQHILYQQDPHDPVAYCKYNPFTAPHSLGGSTLFGTQGSFATNGTLTLREGLPCSMSMPNFHPMKDTRTNGATSVGGFLTVGSAETMCVLPNSKSKQALSYAHTAQQAEPPKYYSATYQVQGQSSISQGPSISINHLQHEGQHPFALPASKNAQFGQSTISSAHNEDTEDNLDLSLKL